jgi:hypothetical protein
LRLITQLDFSLRILLVNNNNIKHFQSLLIRAIYHYHYDFFPQTISNASLLAHFGKLAQNRHIMLRPRLWESPNLHPLSKQEAM